MSRNLYKISLEKRLTDSVLAFMALLTESDWHALVLSNSFCSSYSITVRDFKSLLNVTTLDKTSSSVSITPVSIKVVRSHLIITYADIYFSLGCYVIIHSRRVESKYVLLVILSFITLKLNAGTSL